jgi:hypothetical protein
MILDITFKFITGLNMQLILNYFYVQKKKYRLINFIKITMYELDIPFTFNIKFYIDFLFLFSFYNFFSIFFFPFFFVLIFFKFYISFFVYKFYLGNLEVPFVQSFSKRIGNTTRNII